MLAGRSCADQGGQGQKAHKNSLVAILGEVYRFICATRFAAAI
jgi:hypothetical protein